MKILITGDLHLRVKAPQMRTDAAFMDTCLGKLRQVLDIYDKYGCDVMLQPGDFFDSPQPSGELLAAVIEMLREQRPNLYAIFGQHDLLYHTEASAKRSALRVMEAAETLTIGRGEPDDCVSFRAGDTVFISGASFGQAPPHCSGGGFNILVAHAMVGTRKLWPSQELTGPRAYMKKYPGYDLYVLGDYHYDFQMRVGNTWAINAGCLLRLKADSREMKHRPKVVIFNTETKEPEDVYLDVKPAGEVFDLEAIESKGKPMFDELVDKLTETGQTGVNFRENLAAYFGKNKVDKEIQQKVWEAMGETI